MFLQRICIECKLCASEERISDPRSSPKQQDTRTIEDHFSARRKVMDTHVPVRDASTRNSTLTFSSMMDRRKGVKQLLQARVLRRGNFLRSKRRGIHEILAKLPAGAPIFSTQVDVFFEKFN